MQCKGDDFCNCDGSCMPWRAIAGKLDEPQVIGHDENLLSGFLRVWFWVMLIGGGLLLLFMFGCADAPQWSPQAIPGSATALTITPGAKTLLVAR